MTTAAVLGWGGDCMNDNATDTGPFIAWRHANGATDLLHPRVLVDEGQKLQSKIDSNVKIFVFLISSILVSFAATINTFMKCLTILENPWRGLKGSEVKGAQMHCRAACGIAVGKPL